VTDNFLTNLRETMTTTHAIDALTAENIVEWVRKNWGGLPIYIKKNTGVDSRNAEICRRFNGKNHADLCREFDLSYQQICKIVAQGRKQKAV
jgi:Mor family transcriptional regulator